MLRKSLSLALVAILACAFFMVLPGAQSARADDWTRVADRGFDSNYAMQQDLVSSSFTDGVFYYVGTQSATGFSLWRYDGANWKRLAKEGLGNRDDNSIDSMCMYNGKLYIGCGRGSNNNGCAMYTFDGSHFSKVTDDAFGATGNGSFLRMAVFQGKLYAGTFNPFDGCQVWCYDGVHWAQVNDSGFGTAWNSGVYAMAQTQDHLYIGLRNDQDGCTLRTYDGTTWANITDPQLNVSANVLIQSMFSFNDGTNDQVLFGVFNEGTGCQIWLRNDTGDTLTQVVANGFGDAHNTDAPAIEYFSGQFCVGTANQEEGLQVWANNGTNWANWNPILTGGFGKYAGVFTMDSYAGGLLTSVGGNSQLPVIYKYAGGIFTGTSTAGSYKRTPLMPAGGSSRSSATLGPPLSAGWTPISVPGFIGPNYNWEASCMATFNGDLYAGTQDVVNGCNVYRRDGDTWTPTATPGFGSTSNLEVFTLMEYKGFLYAGTGDQCEVYRYDGNSWSLVNLPSFGNPFNKYIESMVVYNDGLYVTTAGEANTGEVWCYDGAQWSQVNERGFGNDHVSDACLTVSAGRLYAGTGNVMDNQGQVFRYEGGTTWTPVSQLGFDAQMQVNNLASYNGKLYAATFTPTPAKSLVYRWDGPGENDWTAVSDLNFGGGDGFVTCSAVFNGKLYMGTNDAGSIWSYDGNGWSRQNQPGFGDELNMEIASLFANGNELYSGVMNQYYGCQVWRTSVAFSSTSTFFFAEGTTRPNFDTYMCIENPGNAAADVRITYMKGDGTSKLQSLSVPAASRATVHPADMLGVANDVGHDFSAKVECTNGQSIIAERPMYFNYNGVWNGGHDVVGATAPSDTWYFAEGTTRPNFDPYLSICNPGATTASVQVTYMKGDGTTAVQNINVAPGARGTLHPADVLGVANDTAHDFSAKVVSTNGVGIVAERPMYFAYMGDANLNWTGGSDVVGANAPVPDWYFAEGTCRPDFDPYICIQNPGDATADILITYMKGNGTTQAQTASVAAHSRSTIDVRSVLGTGNDAAHDFSVSVSCSNGSIICERPTFFNYQEKWNGGHDVMGATSSAGAFYFAEGSCRPGFDAYLSIQNQNSSAVDVTVTYLKGDGTTATQSIAVAANSRATLHPSDVLGTGNDSAHDFSATVRCGSGQQIIVERPMYFNYKPGTNNWTGGSDVVGYTP